VAKGEAMEHWECARAVPTKHHAMPVVPEARTFMRHALPCGERVTKTSGAFAHSSPCLREVVHACQSPCPTPLGDMKQSDVSVIGGRISSCSCSSTSSDDQDLVLHTSVAAIDSCGSFSAAARGRSHAPQCRNESGIEHDSEIIAHSEYEVLQSLKTDDKAATGKKNEDGSADEATRSMRTSAALDVLSTGCVPDLTSMSAAGG